MSFCSGWLSQADNIIYASNPPEDRQPLADMGYLASYPLD
jgi:hypothetical protein